MKKFNLFLIIALALTAFLAGYLLVRGGLGLDSKSNTGTILDKFNGDTPNDESADTADGSIGDPFLITDKKATSLVNSLSKGTIIYYDKNTGKVFGFNLDTRTEESISEKILPSFISGIWSPKRKEVINSFYSSADSDFRYYNFDTDRTIKLDKNIRSLAFSPDGNLVAFYYFDRLASQSEFGKIILSQPDGTYQKKILDTRIEDLKISWPIINQIAFKTPGSEIFLLTEDGKLTKLLGPKDLLEEKWSLSGKKILYSALNENVTMEPSLSVKEINSMEDTKLDIEGSASKCVWSIDDINIYCALSRSPSIDDIYRINTSDNSTKLILETKTPIKELFLSGSEDYLLFITASDEKLYGIKIPD